MSFNPFKSFGKGSQDSTPVKTTPVRGHDGKFLSTKLRSKKEEKPEVVENKGTTVKGPYPITFNGHEVRRYYQDGKWYFSLDDIAHVAHLNAEDPTIRKGDPEKMEKAKKEYASQIEGIEVAKPKDIAKFIPYFKGNMPGPITDWLVLNADAPVPEDPANQTATKTISPMNPSDAGR